MNMACLPGTRGIYRIAQPGKPESEIPGGRRCCAADKAGETFRRGGNDKPAFSAWVH
jgi:hypothetical protein